MLLLSNITSLHSIKRTDKTLWVSCFLNYETKIMDFLKTGTPVYVNGDITISTYSRETGEVVPTVTMSVRKIELLPNKNKE